MTTTSTGMQIGGEWQKRPKFYVPDMGSLVIYKIEEKCFDSGDGDPALISLDNYPELSGMMFVQKKNHWILPDPRPHTHPWAFYSEVDAGGWFKERRYTFAHGEWTSEIVEHKGGERYFVGLDEIHEVIEVKPNTTTTMFCGKAVNNKTWGYPNWQTGQIVPSQDDPEKGQYFKVFQAANIHVFGKNSNMDIDMSLVHKIRDCNPNIDWPEIA
jgi:hypothetical protein